jgi:LCP family protein required for cell wall assembly
VEHRSKHAARRQRAPTRPSSGASSGFARAIYSTDDLTGADVRKLRQLLAKDDADDDGKDDAGITEPVESPAPLEAGRGGRVRRLLAAMRRIAVGLLSLAVLAVTGVSWAGLQHLENRLNTTQALAAVPAPASTEPDDGATDILLVGSDSRTDANGKPLPLEVLRLLRTEESAGLNTDTLILIRVPHDGGAAFAVSIPRDTYVPIPGYRDDKINSAYGAGKRLAAEELEGQGVTDRNFIERESAASGQRTLVETVQELTGVEIDHYAEVNLYGFYLLTEAIGGVEVCLNHATRDSDSGADFRKGRQLIAGGEALSFVRQRAQLPRGDLDRIVRQQVFMAALVRKTLAAGTLTDTARLTALFDAVQQSVVLDAGWDVLGFATQMQGLAAGKVQFVTIPVQEVAGRNERGQSIVTVDSAAVRAFVAGLLDGHATTPAPAQLQATPMSAPKAPDPVVVGVSNATRRVGLAGRVTVVLAGMGFRTADTENASPRQRTEVLVAPADRASGGQIAAALGGLPVVVRSDQPAGRAQVILGSDYGGPGPHPATSGAATATASAQPAATAAPDVDAPITADGIPCVN